jgi:hypothetical protein
MQSSGPVIARDRIRGKGMARPEEPREPKQSWRAQTAHAWMWAIATTFRVSWRADVEQARSRLAWAWTVSRVAATSITGLSLSQA